MFYSYRFSTCSVKSSRKTRLISSVDADLHVKLGVNVPKQPADPKKSWLNPLVTAAYSPSDETHSKCWKNPIVSRNSKRVCEFFLSVASVNLQITKTTNQRNFFSVAFRPFIRADIAQWSIKLFRKSDLSKPNGFESCASTHNIYSRILNGQECF